MSNVRAKKCGHSIIHNEKNDDEDYFFCDLKEDMCEDAHCPLDIREETCELCGQHITLCKC
jgi:hypothetical protein